jgi:hypothetical protein
MPRRRGEVIFAHGGEVVVDALTMGLQAGFVPCGTELAASADVGEDEDASAREPEVADDAGVMRRHGDLEAAVSGHDGGVGAVVLQVLTADDEVGDFGSVGRGRLKLLDEETGGVELCGKGFGGLQGRGRGVAERE